ncbi:DUF3040 domain-containing protein [Amycolatopsis alkalitolerans]|uniref:DUF3040 domain-containing protein n=1 Tax=Amycolatopsis alkalitolerans TaxID=2547244 RepID=A0A5C4M4F7_9PSEU|nr:DUF3040 domain-containing protein [Amycolatopsis alkalitolerans]TNC28039.1 DUF3040 domain-containing protein [Amycolatopsis alkalitolerans]
MGLRDEEQRRLTEIEHGLAAEDPRLARRLTAVRRPLQARLTVLVPCVVAALLGGLALMTVGAQWISLGLIVTGTLLAVFAPTALIVWRFGWRHRRW